MNNSEKIYIRGYWFPVSELTGYNPYNDHEGTPIPELIELSYAWCEAACIYRKSLTNDTKKAQ